MSVGFVFRCLAMFLLLVLVLYPFGCDSLPRQPDWSEEDLARKWCQIRRGEQCCRGRNDECTVPMHGTLCYCDDFCNSTALDCCPDFWSFCMGTRPPWGFFTTTTTTTPRIDIPDEPGSGDINQCYKNGRFYDVGESVKDNCNECICQDDHPFSDHVSWSCTRHACLMRRDMVETINYGQYGWRASNYSFLHGLTLADGIKYRLGTFQPSNQVFSMSALKSHHEDSLPESFDSRQRWPGLISDIRDQGDCGSSWALSTAAIASDRLAIGSNGRIVKTLSPQHLLSCVGGSNNSCEGGNIDQAWGFLRRYGGVTEDCYPYQARTDQCTIPKLSSPDICPSGRVFKEHMKFKMTPPYRIRNDEHTIKKQIYENGPVQAIFNVKEDFFVYRSGVYRHVNTVTNLPQSYHQTGSHSVRIIGWGVDYSNGFRTKYWLCANSWGPNWGEKGYFRILRGQNECDIESFVISAWPHLPQRLHRYQSKRKRRSLDENTVKEILFGTRNK
ncbi:peptidase C1 [Octopus vulgaris]|uniref:Peptidase C1 n=1 Tax=Octopus vulgaris TaxID=6645 RepID=A0AA36BEP2_OCTVU|nr:peptidase C1 [Octopus vulgaris]